MWYYTPIFLMCCSKYLNPTCVFSVAKTSILKATELSKIFNKLCFNIYQLTLKLVVNLFYKIIIDCIILCFTKLGASTINTPIMHESWVWYQNKNVLKFTSISKTVGARKSRSKVSPFPVCWEKKVNCSQYMQHALVFFWLQKNMECIFFVATLWLMVPYQNLMKF